MKVEKLIAKPLKISFAPNIFPYPLLFPKNKTHTFLRIASCVKKTENPSPKRVEPYASSKFA